MPPANGAELPATGPLEPLAQLLGVAVCDQTADAVNKMPMDTVNENVCQWLQRASFNMNHPSRVSKATILPFVSGACASFSFVSSIS